MIDIEGGATMLRGVKKDARNSLNRIAQNGVVKLIAAGLAFVSQVALVKLIGGTSYGFYVYLVSYCSFIVAISKGGIDIVLLRESAVAWSGGMLDDVHRLRREAFRYVILIGMPCIVVIALIINRVGISPHGQVPPNIWWASSTSVAMLILAIVLSCAKGIGRVTSAEAVDSILKPITTIAVAALICNVSIFSPPSRGYFPFIVANLTSAIILYVFYRTIIKKEKFVNSGKIISLGNLLGLHQSFILTLSSLVNFAYFQLDTLIVASKLGAQEAASYNMACNFVRLVIFIALIVAGQAQPALASDYRNRNLSAVKNRMIYCVGLSIGCAIAATIFLAIFGRSLLCFVSPKFEIAYVALLILSIAHIFNSVVIVLAAALNMFGLQKYVLMSQVFGAVLGIPAMLIFVNYAAMKGVAMGVLVAIGVNFIGLSFFSIRHFARRYS